MFVILCLIAMVSPISPIVPRVVQGQPVIARVIADCRVYADSSLKFPVGDARAGEFAEVLEDFTMRAYRIRISDNGTEGWIDGANLIIPPDPPTDMSIAPIADLEKFVNDGGYISKTKYLVLTDIARQQTHVFYGASGAWRHIRRFSCSTGENASPTTRGEFRMEARGEWFYSARLGAGGKWWIRFNGDYLYHSIPMDENRQIIPGEDVVGVRRSAGCVRLLPDCAKWLYDNVPDGTTVIIE